MPRRKTKTGCRTCKIRRVKCGEERPACQRCVSTGRVCDGYGIWGGGGNGYGSAERRGATRLQVLRQTRSPTKDKTPALVPGMNLQDQTALDFFWARTSIKLPGVFDSGFWDSLVFQASFSEPAVLHAVIALAATHRRHGMGTRPMGGGRNPLSPSTVTEMDPDERLALQHYNKAIAHLRCHFEKKDVRSLRITLISCMVFVCMELLRGEFQTGLAHLQSGLKVLEEVHARDRLAAARRGARKTQKSAATTDAAPPAAVLLPRPESVDDYLLEAFTRLNVQSALFGQGSEFLYRVGQDKARNGRLEYDMPTVFGSVNSARRHLDGVLNGVYLLSTEISQLTCTQDRGSGSGTARIPARLVQRKDRLQKLLASWIHACTSSPCLQPDTSLSVVPTADNYRSILGLPLLRLYHSMASIMVATCLRGNDEGVFDAFTADFAAMLLEAMELWARVAQVMGLNIPAGCGCRRLANQADISFTVDMGFIPPLYYAALKCRVPRFRRQALKFLKATPHREGLWDGALAAAVARAVIKMEEGDFYNIFREDNDGLDVNQIPTALALDDLPLVPVSSRVNDVTVLLPGEMGGTATLVCRQYRHGPRGSGGGWQTKNADLPFDSNVPVF
ncbi:hypothetical protein B0T24DRAFT_539402 [Lasiosphaeria ovina]|uniref:Zn(2)-C6 fungal-type domain-containing protein n=1 Tax=Lasiosphaeria ovina TaxID=92902 RepID=A0AAE0JTG1_9PEZI|nr:hypothetical protein B0T24DRAFT_539402 [Lasiosphaeria ovina]